MSGSGVECEVATGWGDGGVAEVVAQAQLITWESKPRELSLRDLLRSRWLNPWGSEGWGSDTRSSGPG